jgi:hypothetical protein
VARFAAAVEALTRLAHIAAFAQVLCAGRGSLAVLIEVEAGWQTLPWRRSLMSTA